MLASVDDWNKAVVFGNEDEDEEDNDGRVGASLRTACEVRGALVIGVVVVTVDRNDAVGAATASASSDMVRRFLRCGGLRYPSLLLPLLLLPPPPTDSVLVGGSSSCWNA